MPAAKTTRRSSIQPPRGLAAPVASAKVTEPGECPDGRCDGSGWRPAPCFPGVEISAISCGCRDGWITELGTGITRWGVK
ncbi:hypothetical protein ACIRPK_06100 [Kitasatospora sp. NPDC101801]|uniref:hypothetical protein n=1 Tax=Kitasatospora sp. NPDC101801 TaxID=3364103 RepID=UPI0037F2A06B